MPTQLSKTRFPGQCSKALCTPVASVTCFCQPHFKTLHLQTEVKANVTLYKYKYTTASDFFYLINSQTLQIGIGISKFSIINSEELHIGNFLGDGSLKGDRNRYR